MKAKTMKNYCYENYTGNDDFVFMRCAKADRAKSALLARELSEAGIRLFFDVQGSKGAELPARIAEAIEKCETAVFMMSESAGESLELRNSINFALELKKHIVCIRLDDKDFTHGLDMQLANIQTIRYADYGDFETFKAKLIELEVITQGVLGATPVRKNINMGRQLLKVAIAVVILAAAVFAARLIINNRIAYYSSAGYLFRDADGSEYLNISAYAEEGLKALEGMSVKELDLRGSEIYSLEEIRKVDMEVLDLTDCHNLRRLDQLESCGSLHTVRISQDLIRYVPQNLGYLEFEITK